VPSALGLPKNIVRPVSLVVGASISLFLGACSFVGDAPELTVAEQLEKLSGRSLTQTELDGQLELAGLLCNLDQKVLNELWGQLDARQTEFQDFVFGQHCPERMELYLAARPDMGKVPEAQQTTTTATTAPTTRPTPPQSSTIPRTTPTSPSDTSTRRTTTTTTPTTTRSTAGGGFGDRNAPGPTTTPSTTRSTAGPAYGDRLAPGSTTTTSRSTVDSDQA